MSEFLDELARTMAKPMPRSRAIRMLGMAVASAALPALRPNAAAGRSFTPSCHHARCGAGELLCKCHVKPQTGNPVEPTMCNFICCDPDLHTCACPPRRRVQVRAAMQGQVLQDAPGVHGRRLRGLR